jgi:hypothetical protein
VAKSYPHLDIKIAHTGQHYDEKMANIFFDQFELRPDYFLNIKPGTPIQQMAEIMTAMEDLIENTFQLFSTMSPSLRLTIDTNLQAGANPTIRGRPPSSMTT